MSLTASFGANANAENNGWFASLDSSAVSFGHWRSACGHDRDNEMHAVIAATTKYSLTSPRPKHVTNTTRLLATFPTTCKSETLKAKATP